MPKELSKNQQSEKLIGLGWGERLPLVPMATVTDGWSSMSLVLFFFSDSNKTQY